MTPNQLLRIALLASLSAVAPAQTPKETKPARVAEAPAPQPPVAPHALIAADVASFFDAAVPMQLERENIAGAVVAVVVSRVHYTLIGLACIAFVWFNFTMRLLDWSLRY